MNDRLHAIRVIVGEADTPQRMELLRTLQRDGDIAVVGVAATGAEAVVLVAQAQPDAVILDLHLDHGQHPDQGHHPDHGGRHTIEQLMARCPTPILVLSANIDDRNSPSAVEALVSGALEALPRPVRWTPELGAQLRRTVHQISKVRVIRHPRGNRAEVPRPHRVPRPGRAPVVAVAASTGGPSALAVLLAGLGDLPAPVLVVQHLHPDFTGGLLEWMDRASALPVEMAAHGQTPRGGHVYLAPGGVHLRMGSTGTLELRALPASLHRPSADQLFESIAEQGSAGIGVLLTGMGDDGARGLLAISRSGGQTFAQDEATCAVFGMPRAAQRLGAVTDLLPLDALAAAIHRAVRSVRV